MKSLFLIFLICFFAVAQDEELELLPPDVLKRKLLHRETDPVSEELLKAAALYNDKKWDSAYSIYMELSEKVPELLYGPIAIRIAKCELERGYIEESRKILLSMRSIKNNKKSWEHADRILVEGILRDPEIEQEAKMDSLQQRLKFKPNTNHENFLRFKLAAKQETIKETENAIANYFAIFRAGGQYSDSAFLALRRLVPNSKDQDFIAAMCRRRKERCAERTDRVVVDENAPFGTKNANRLWVKALEFEQAKEHKNAIDTYEQLYDSNFGRNQRRQWAKFRVGFINFKEEKYAEAAKIFAEAASDSLGLMPRSASLYFYAECQRLLGNKDSAANAYFAVISDFPLGYYAWRAKQNLEEYKFPDNIPKLSVKTTDSAAIVWLRALQEEGTGRDSVVGTLHLEQVSILLRSGFEQEAFAFYNEALKFHRNRPEFYYRYGVMFIQNGEYALAQRLARNFLEIVPRQKMVDVPAQVLQFLFPVPHEAKVKRHATIDPFFIYSVMRQESMFDAQIQSPAGARGLMQVMPTTGDFLAKREGIENFDKDMLYNAYLNIRLGVRLLNDLTTEHKGDYIGILGEYNAGPRPTNRWLASHGSLPWDIRVEEVSYWETRDYVKRVLGNYWVYKEVYN
ncbi:MAG: transglycosylase SLT domain-containing protein [Fibromonadaceae bacterium]|jgi:soluble lytic murein transglycosylase|nr:transglycosylase SLT domain-containing protein [Fibromonadaceae bacterium]